MKRVPLILLLLSIVLAQGQKLEVFATPEGAIRGYDPVAYFTDNKPVKGQHQFAAEWKGQTWYFSSAKNKMVFTASPGTYAPQYGGFCAFGMSRGYKATSDPYAYNIVDGKLYLLYSRTILEDWVKQRQHYIHVADKNWPGVKGKEK
jgi:YHS domain-containing protein